jgi:hypothetical protein
VEAAPFSRAAVLEQRYRSRLPVTLDELVGPDRGMVPLPSHVAWSGLTAFDVDRPPLRVSMYHIVLTEGLREDLATYINRGLLVREWPVLRMMVGRVIRDVWESVFPELVESVAPGRVERGARVTAAGPRPGTPGSSTCRRTMGA